MQLYSKNPLFGILGPLAALVGVALVGALCAIFLHAPTEATMGIVQKIFYFHVPSAISAYVGFVACGIGSVYYLVSGDVRADAFARASAEVGVLFCTFVLISGPLWARKAWGTWWTGEPRLLLTLVLMLIFVAYLVVRTFGPPTDLTRKIGAALAILGVADIPLVRMSVERWRGNHPQVLRNGGGGLAPDMMDAFVVSFAAIALLFAAVLLYRYRVALLEEDAERMHRAVNNTQHRAEALVAQRSAS